MYSRQEQIRKLESVSYPLGEYPEHLPESRALALLTLSHTPVEQELYLAMRSQQAGETRFSAFPIRGLMRLTRIKGYSSIRRGLNGLVEKRSIERQSSSVGKGKRSSYVIFEPDEIFRRRRQAGMAPYPDAALTCRQNAAFGRALERVTRVYDLSRREAQVALCCAEGLSNLEIGKRLGVCGETIKFHLRHIFLKLGVRRRAELVSRLLMEYSERENGEENV